MFKSHNLLPFLDAKDNVAIVLLLAGHDSQAARMHAVELLSYLEVGNRKDTFPAMLSGGEAQHGLESIGNVARIFSAARNRLMVRQCQTGTRN